VTDRRTDRQTDGIGVAYTRYSIYAVARKKWQAYTLANLILKKLVKSMPDFKAKMHQNRFRMGLCPRPRWGAYQRWVKYSIVQVQVQVQVPLPYNPVQVQVRKLEFKKKLHSETIILKKLLSPIVQ